MEYDHIIVTEDYPFLALVSKQKIDNNIECIGPWCYLDDFANGDFSSLNKNYHIAGKENPNKLKLSANADEYHDRFICHLSGVLNQHHGRNYSQKYWSILLSASVTYVIESVLNKIHLIEDNKNDYEADVFDLKSHPVINSTRSLMGWLNSDDGTLYTFSYILLHSNQNKIIIKKRHNFIQKKIGLFRRLNISRRVILEYLKTYLAIFFSLKNGVYIESIPGLSFKDIVSLNIQNKEKIKKLLLAKKAVASKRVKREKIFSEFEPKNLEEEVIQSILTYTLPTIFFENFKKYEKICSLPSYLINHSFDKLYCGPLFGGNDIAKFIFSKCVDNKSELIISQHGSNYGTALVFTTMNLCEYKNCDSFISWGWKAHSDYKIKVKSLPSPYLSKLKTNYKNISINEIVFVGNNLSIYGDRISSGPNAQELCKFFNDKAKFVGYLSDQNSKLLRYKPYPASGNGLIDEASFIKSKVKNIIFKEDNNHFLTSSRLLVVDHPGTIMLERFVVNKPIIIFFDKAIWSFSKQSQEFFDLLSEVNVIHYSPYLAANFVNINYELYEEWWYSDEVQRVVTLFVNSYAKNSSDFINEWKEYFSIH